MFTTIFVSLMLVIIVLWLRVFNEVPSLLYFCAIRIRFVMPQNIGILYTVLLKHIPTFVAFISITPLCESSTALPYASYCQKLSTRIILMQQQKLISIIQLLPSNVPMMSLSNFIWRVLAGYIIVNWRFNTTELS